MTIGARRPAAWLAALLAGGGLLAACSSSGGPDTAGPNASGSDTTSAAAPSTPAAAGTPSGSGTPADPATKQQIAKAYGDFFNSTSTAAVSQAALQHGEAFTKTLEEQSKGAYAQKSGVTVGAVSVQGDLGFVTFTITNNGQAMLSNFKGYAVREGGRWKVAATTFCTLLTLEGHPPAACKDPAITALPK